MTLKTSQPWSETVYYAECPYCDEGAIQIGTDGDCGFDGMIVQCPKCKRDFMLEGEPDK